jgi:hypothetical protein
MEMKVPQPVVEADRLSAASAALVVTPHPLTLQGQQVLGHQAAALVPGESLAAFVGRHGVEPGQQWVVTIGGVEVLEAHWGRVRPKHGHLVECRRVPQKDVLRIVAFVALSYFTFGAGGLGSAGGFLGMGTGLGAQIAAGVVFLAGSMVINKLLGPKQLSAAENTTSPTYSLQSGGRNQARLFQPLPLVLGEPYAVPDVGAQPFTFFRDGEQYLWQIFNLGLNCADAFNLRVGQTDLAAYTGVTVLRSGLASGNTALPALGSSVDTVAGAELTAPAGFGPFVQRTSSAGTVRLALDIVASLFSVDGRGAYGSRALDLTVEYRLVGSSTWLPMTPYVAGSPAVTYPVSGETSGGGSYSYTVVVTPEVPAIPAGVLPLVHASSKPLRRTLEIDVPEGQYEVRLQKRHADFTGTSGSNQVQWVSLKSYQKDTASYEGQARLAVQIQASGQLNGSLDELNAQLRAKPMPYWNGSAWVTATDRASGLCNPGAIFLLLVRGIYDGTGRLLFGMGFSDDRIDMEGLKLFMVRCATKGFQFDLYQQDTTSIGELLDAVAYAGMGEVSWPDGKLGVTFFAEDDPITGVINMGTIKARSFSVGYDTRTTADEVEGQFFDRARGNSWRSLRVMAPGVTTPRSTGRLQLVGIGNEVHAATMTRFLMGQNVYQRKSVELEMDLEYMTHRKGSVVALSHDMTAWGYSGRLMACQDVAGTVRLTLDDEVPATNPTGGASARYIGLRLAGESQMRVFPIKAFGGRARVVELDAAWPGGVALPGATAADPAQDTLWVYDFKATPGNRMRVAAVKPMASSAGARLTLVPEPVEFWPYVLSGDYTPPPNNSLLRSAPAVDGPVRVVEELLRQGNTFFTELTLSFATVGNFKRAELWGATGDGEASPPQRLLVAGQSHNLSWRGGLDERWHLELRVWGDTRAGEPYRLFYDVQGLSVPPPMFDFFVVLAQPDGTRQFNFGYTTTPKPADWLGAEIRYLVGTHTTPAWDSMLQLQDDRTHYTASPIEVNQLLSGPHTFACRSVDTTGNQGEIRYVQITLPPRRLGNTVAEFDEAKEFWPGTLNGCTLNTANNTIEANSTTTWDSLTSWDAWTRWTLDPVSPISYLSAVRDLKAVLTGLIDVSVAALGSTALELRSSATSADPVANPGEWTAWGPADLKFAGRWVQIRATVTATGPEPVPVLSALTFVVSAPLINEYINDLSVSTLSGAHRIAVGDVRVPIENSFGTLLEIYVVNQDTSAGSWSWVLVDKDLVVGPRVQFRLNGVLADPSSVDFIVRGF